MAETWRILIRDGENAAPRDMTQTVARLQITPSEAVLA